MSLYLLRRGANGHVAPCWTEIERTYQQLESFFDQLQMFYRPIALTKVRCSLGRLIEDHSSKWGPSLQSRGRSIELKPPIADVEGDLDPIQIGIALDAMAKWRAEVGDSKSHTRISWGDRDGSLEIDWEELSVVSGVPHPPDLAGVEADPDGDTRTCRQLDSLVVLLVGRIMAAHGGRLERTGESSLRWRMHWPRDHARASPDLNP